MTDGRRRKRIAAGFVVAVITGVILGSVVQTQFNLLALQELGVSIGIGVRLSATFQDLLHFAPLYAVMFGVSFLFSVLVAAALLRLLRLGVRAPFYALAAAVGLWVTFTSVNALAPMPTLIAATRTPDGLIAMLFTAALSGWLFAWLTASNRRSVGGYAMGPALVLLLSAGVIWPVAQARAESPGSYQVKVLAEGLEHPWSLAFLPDGGALVTERSGRLRLMSPEGRLEPQAIQGVPTVFSSGQAGLFDVMLSPQFAADSLVFLSYACGSATANHLCVARGKLNERELVGVTEIFRAQPAKRGNAHYGGRMAFLPDGSLVITLGDGFDYREQAQVLSNHLGSIVRLRPDGSVPQTNPFLDREEARPEIFSYGHRNVQGLIYDPVEDLLIAHEHGPRGGDEINIIEPGKNYGWPVITFGRDYTGALVSPFTESEGMEQPVLQWTPSIAPSGMTRYRGNLFPEWQGNLLVGALADRSVHRIELDGGQARDIETLFADLDERIRDVVTGPDGALYLLTDNLAGRILRVSPKP
ncbi:glucose sorbosone dehydrogenase [Marinobacter salinus]|uniref:Glucose sorbosone dehydrogenase n=1 Tax=Marinobacter salinus TaxID=1874317 RepID=A0A1D9GI78_9GAMM|nr:PQQ-dependent sugar dehydrogenase [Marinobacter salinus]AOY87313.1 glucose sorbosone dehydrogenase [Marinobacter salinus]